MDDWITLLYEQAPRFDEGELYHSLAYQAAMAERKKIQSHLTARFGRGVEELLQAYTDTLYDEMELEAQHYFQEGCRAARKNVI